VHVRAGESAHVHMTINPRDLSYVNEAGDRIIAAGSYKLSIGGGQPGTDAKVIETGFTISGEARLPE